VSKPLKVLVILAIIPFALLGIAVLSALFGPIPIVMGLVGGTVVLIVKSARKKKVES
jgi:hypothetical protein